MLFSQAGHHGKGGPGGPFTEHMVHQKIADRWLIRKLQKYGS